MYLMIHNLKPNGRLKVYLSKYIGENQIIEKNQNMFVLLKES